ncbi:hypothetical protein HYV84_07520 [Candidatus Woesearchaeota archaeon]|nr:hypothetical protein [Candidatus Woesearchaeota archaeon]
MKTLLFMVPILFLAYQPHVAEGLGADLLTPSITFSPPRLNTTIESRIDATVRLIGQGFAFSYIEVDITKLGNTTPEWVGTYEFALSPGQNITQEINNTNIFDIFPLHWKPKENGVYIASVSVDPENVVFETNETNNVFYTHIQVGMPDFDIVNGSIEISPETIKAGNITSINLSVVNSGDGPFKSFVECDITPWRSETPDWVGTFNFSLSKNESITLQVINENESDDFTVLWSPEANGVYIMGCAADPPFNSSTEGDYPFGSLLELDEENNAEYTALQVGTPDFFFVQDSILFFPRTVFVNDTMNISATVVNSGEGPFISYAEMDINPWGEEGETPAWVGTFEFNLADNQTMEGIFLNEKADDEWENGPWVPDKEGIYIAAALIDPPFNSTEEGYRPHGYLLESNESNNKNYSALFVYSKKKNSTNQVEWLEAQLSEEQEDGPGKLVKSYGQESLIPFNGYSYDQALAVIGFFLENRTDLAKQTLEELRHLQSEDGSFPFCWMAYRPNTTKCWPRKMVGSNAWIIMAVNAYTIYTGDAAFIPLAEKNAAWILNFQEEDGGLTGGIDFNGTDFKPITWKSTEHNLDVYSALHYLFLLTGNETYENASVEVRKWLETEAWNEAEGRFNQGENDSYPVTDTNTWGILALGAGNSSLNFSRGMRWILNYTKYFDINTGVEGFDFNYDNGTGMDNDGTNDGVDTVWVEGTEGAALAFHEIGDEENALFFHAEMGKLVQPDGSLPYATREGSLPQLGTTNNWTSVAGTAWNIMGKHKYNPFKPLLANMRIPLQDGWNLISIPVNTSNSSVKSLLWNVNFSYLVSFPPLAYYINGGSHTFEDINTSKSYWVKSEGMQTISALGNYADHPLMELKEGWNSIAYPFFSAAWANQTFNNPSILSVFALNNSLNSSQWLSYSPARPDSINTLKKITPGMGLVIAANDDTNISLRVLNAN